MEKPWSLYHIPAYNRHLIQGNMHFRVSADSFLLSQFFRVNRKCKSILEIGTGTAIIPILLSHSCISKIDTVEIQECMVELARKNVTLNALDEQIKVHCFDILEIKKHFATESFTHVLSNPPYFESTDACQEKASEGVRVAKSETLFDFAKFIQVSHYALKSHGVLTFIHRSEYLEKIISTLNRYHFHISRLQFVYTQRTGGAKMVLVEAIKGEVTQVKIGEPIYLNSQNAMLRLDDFESLESAFENSKIQI